MTTFSPELVRSEVDRFWDAFCSKNVDVLQDFYAHESVGFGSASTRTEPGRLSATRRQREYFGSSSPIRAQITNLEIIMINEHAAIAAYTFDFQATRTLPSGKSEEHVRNGRATHVFAFDPDGNLRIFHEHLSLPA